MSSSFYNKNTKMFFFIRKHRVKNKQQVGMFYMVYMNVCICAKETFRFFSVASTPF